MRHLSRQLTHSLRARLTGGFLILVLLVWSSASALTWYQTRDALNELFDTQQMLFAKRLLAFDLSQLKHPLQLPQSHDLLRKHRGDQDKDALAFAIFNADGRMLLNDGDNGDNLVYRYQGDGFTDGYLDNDDDSWRLLWLTTPDGRYRILVGQEWDYRNDMALSIVGAQMVPWLVALPVMVILLLLVVSRGLAPLHRLAAALRRRRPDDATPLPREAIPSEVWPVVASLNTLFARTNAQMVRERRFTSDAAHELRTPLAALRVQAEVVQLAQDDLALRQRALGQLEQGIDRATRLVDQLLTLSRLDSLSQLDDVQPRALAELLQTAVIDMDAKAHAAGVALALSVDDPKVCRRIQPLLFSLLIRNLLDNAIRYSPTGSQVTLRLTSHRLQITDNGAGVSDAVLQRLGERFYRPPGQEKTGSGLGLSIVRQIASLHGMQVQFDHAPGGGFQATLRW
ncbi:quorum sensing histidine kinase QseC [Edwardsiella piscicida]|uniref:Sensor protein QseC n=5 Tax=Edwardsiella TaxID=635 RepID=A0A0H3DMZ5_EDWTF|nr:quorum sensing histidine kinase QseC [Edwardsiella piscicida]ACY83294.1 sensor protein QseC [Edwardsiella tarda EIB202]ADM40524.1 Sensory histidine kinase QseC [Edwardsiella tarda FL6-60]AOP41928.1 two-component system sensor histidine kinase QseC [Edwardsiella piscicida]ARD17894.1 two-component sensor histidine kinase [Edwardsiella piscicida]EKS7766780.1 two-component system sensor histidine kinase QseC [Edwardsiella piscicida]